MTPIRHTTIGLAVLAALVMSSPASLAGVHTVRSGDTLWGLSKEYNVSVQALASANGLSEKSTLQIGQKLTVPGSSTSASTPAASEPASAGPAGKSGLVLKAAILRTGPSTTKGERIATLYPGKELRILDTQWGWHKVKTQSGTVGWVAEYLVKPSNNLPSWYAASAAPKADVVNTAMQHLGARYRYGGSSRGGFDCSGFTRYVYSRHGVSLPHNSAAQFSKGTPVKKSDLVKGDLVFFSRGSLRVGHVGVYVGDGKFVHASNPRGGVKVSALSESYYSSRYVGARRVK